VTVCRVSAQVSECLAPRDKVNAQHQQSEAR